MLETIEANWVVFAVALLAALVVGWWLFGRAATTPDRRERRPDVLDEGQAPAQRNQALIDAPPAAQIVPPPVSPALGGLAEAVAVGAQEVVEEARAADPEAAPEPVAEPAPELPPQPDPAPVLPDETPRESPPAPQAAPEAPAQPGPAPELPDAQPAEPAPAPQSAPPAAPAAAPAADDLARIKGLGPKLQALLPSLGITTFAQIAAMTEADLAELDGKLGIFAGRPAKDNWVEQARFLAEGDVAGFEARFGKV